ncbi:MAG: hypothetical protein WHS44_08930 [Fimbriimonadales bacterium]|nr:MAG: hypothetical protein KatS3mg018_1244 [Fimbriimonadales bacterium]
MDSGKRLQEALRAFHFRRWEPQIRQELAALLECPPDMIAFVDWEEHDPLLSQRSQLYALAEAGRCPRVAREWQKTDWGVLESALASLANKVGGYSTYLYFPKYLASFVPYQGYEECEVPLVRIDRLGNILLRVTRLLDQPQYFGYFECILSDLANIISFDFGEVVDYEAKPTPVRLELYTVVGTGSLAASWISCL